MFYHYDSRRRRDGGTDRASEHPPSNPHGAAPPDPLDEARQIALVQWKPLNEKRKAISNERNGVQ